MYVCEVDKPWSETPFLFQGFPLMNEADLSAVRQLCRFVFIDESRSIDITRRLATISADPKAQKLLSQEVEEARRAYRAGERLVKNVFENVQLGRGINTAQCRHVIRSYVQSLSRNEAALMWLTRIKEADDYTSQHCLSVAILGMGFARFLGYTELEIEQVGLCGLLHDVGKIKVDQSLLNKPARLSSDEFAQIKQHAIFGYELLQAHIDLPPAVVDVAYNHHERPDGKGYPRGLTAERLPQLARLIGLCDCYDAVTSNRCYDRARPPKDAFRILMQGRDTQFDGKMVMKFIQWMGIFPVGTIVELHTGEIAIVLEVNRSQRLRPRIVVVRGPERKLCKPRYLDLSKITVDYDQQPYRIKDSLPDGAYGVRLADPAIQAVLNPEQLAILDEL